MQCHFHKSPPPRPTRYIWIEWNLSYTEPGHNGNLYLAENIYILENPNFKYLYEAETLCNGRKLGYLSLRYRQVSLYERDFCF
jgi:hypothetical protein